MFLDVTNTLAPTAPTIPTSVGVAIFSAYALDYAKRLKALPVVNYYSTKLNSWLRLFLSGLGTLGVSWAWSAAGTGHQLLITIPAWSVIFVGLYHWGVQYGTMHFSEIILSQRPGAQTAIRSQGETAPMEVPVEKVEAAK